MKLFKKSISLLLAVLMVLSLAVTAFAEQTTAVMLVTASKTDLTVGDEFSVYLNASDDIGGIFAFQMDLYYDQDMFEYLGAETAFTPNHNTNKTTGARYIRLTTLDFNSNATISKGAFCELKFRVLKAGSYHFELTTVKITDDKSQAIMNVATAPGSVDVTATDAPAYTGYAVSASEDKTVSVGENAEVKVTVANSDPQVTAYNAYDLTLTYDTEKLTYVSGIAADADASVEEDSGTIRVKGYGADKALSTPALTLTFRSKTPSDAEVKITAAKVDVAAQAIENDAPEATILDDTTVITASSYTVTLGDGLTGAASVAPGENYTFRAADAAHYDYVITATMGGETVTFVDNGDGTYTIPAVSGNLVISAQMTAKRYQVTVDGTGAADVTAADSASYNTDFTFTVREDANYTYTVSVTVGGSAYALGTPENGTYTIPGTAVTGSIAITVNKTVKPSSVVNVAKPDYVNGDNTAVKGKDYTFTIEEDENYTYGEPVVKVGDTDITDQLVKNEDGSYTIPGACVTGNITIEVTRSVKTDVDAVEYITLNGKSMFLVTATGSFPEGQTPKYDGLSMYWSEKYQAYAYLVISADGLEAVKAEAIAKITVAEGAAAGTVDATGDVNGTTRVDVNDAQLTYDMYNAKYEAFDVVSMLKFLNADVNGDKVVNVNDAAAIVAQIK